MASATTSSVPYAAPTKHTTSSSAEDASKSNKACHEIQDELPNIIRTIQPVQVDIGNDDSIDALYNEIESKDEKLDILVNNAGITSHLSPSPICMNIVF